MTAPPNREVLILAGPNGAGKTTFAREFLLNEAHCPTFVNADLIAAGLSPFKPELAAMRAGRIMEATRAGSVNGMPRAIASASGFWRCLHPKRPSPASRKGSGMAATRSRTPSYGDASPQAS